MEFLVPPIKRFLPDGREAAKFPLTASLAARGRGAKLAADYLAGQMGREFGADLRRGGRTGKTELVVEVGRGLLRGIAGLPTARRIRTQAYRLAWRPGSEVLIQAEGAAGALHGATALRQILASQEEGVPIPAGVIEDWPALEWRGVQDDMAAARVYSPEHTTRQIRRVAELRGNMFQLYLEGSFAFPRRPDAGTPGSMTPQQARELEAYASRLGVTLLPQVNTFGHLHWLLINPRYQHLRENPDSPQCLCPLHPETRPLLKDLLDDIMDAFASPFIPVGLDEVRFIGLCPRCKGRDPGELFLDHVKFLHGAVTSRGRRMLMWHDMVLDRVEFAGSTANGPTEWAARVLDALPRDIVICDWQYIASADTARHFTGKGFATMACDSTYGPIRRDFPFDFSAAWHTSRLYAAAARAGAMGTIQTNWSTYGDRSLDNLWLFSANSLSMAWQPAQRVQLRSMARDWARVEMGNDGLAYEDLIARLSVPLFGGTALRSVTREETVRSGFFRFARAWWRSAGASLVAGERAYTDDLAGRLESLRASAKRGREYLAMLDLPIAQRRLQLDEVRRIGRAARLYSAALYLPAGHAGRRGRIERAAALLREHADGHELLAEPLQRAARLQGTSESALRSLCERQAEIRARAARLTAEPPPAFEDVFWSETETPYNR